METDQLWACESSTLAVGNLLKFRRARIGPIRELANRLLPVTQAIGRFRGRNATRVASNAHVAFFAVAVILLRWPDTDFPHQLTTGFRVIGDLRATGLWRPLETLMEQPIKRDFISKGKDFIKMLEETKRPTK